MLHRRPAPLAATARFGPATSVACGYAPRPAVKPSPLRPFARQCPLHRPTEVARPPDCAHYVHETTVCATPTARSLRPPETTAARRAAAPTSTAAEPRCVPSTEVPGLPRHWEVRARSAAAGAGRRVRLQQVHGHPVAQARAAHPALRRDRGRDQAAGAAQPAHLQLRGHQPAAAADPTAGRRDHAHRRVGAEVPVPARRRPG